MQCGSGDCECDSKQPEGEGVGVFPNPTAGKFEVKYYSEKNSLVAFELINSIGQIIFKEEQQMMQGINAISFGELVPIFREGRDEVDGIYLLKISFDDKLITKKIIVEK
jgi:hypothetical protein